MSPEDEKREEAQGFAAQTPPGAALGGPGPDAPSANDPAGSGDPAPGERSPRSSPQTDPTNPLHQEATGKWVAAENTSERHVNEPGMTDKDRDQRAPTY